MSGHHVAHGGQRNTLTKTLQQQQQFQQWPVLIAAGGAWVRCIEQQQQQQLLQASIMVFKHTRNPFEENKECAADVLLPRSIAHLHHYIRPDQQSAKSNESNCTTYPHMRAAPPAASCQQLQQPTSTHTSS
jgi:hypothetical protein